MPWLFSYGTLRDPGVQRAVFGRLLAGEPDGLPGFVLGEVAIADPEVVAASGMAIRPILHRDAGARTPIASMALAIGETYLPAVDRYEGETYTRIEVTLTSGRTAFVYVAPATQAG